MAQVTSVDGVPEAIEVHLKAGDALLITWTHLAWIAPGQ